MKNKIVSWALCLWLILGFTTSCSTKDEYRDSPIENFEALWNILDRGYSFFDLKLPPDTSWRDIYHKYRPEIRPNMSNDSLFLVMNNMLRELRDGHVNLITPFDNGRYWDWQTKYPANYNAELVEKYIGDARLAGGLYYTHLKYNGHEKDSIGYLRFSSFSNALSDGNLNAALSRLRACKALIIDIRSNGGGNLTTSDLFARHFLAEGRVVGSTISKNGPGHRDFSSPIPIRLEPLSLGVRWLRPVVLLTNRGVYSAANDFVLRMKGLPLVTVMGDKTGGGGGMPMSSELPNGWGVRYSSTQTFDPQGKNIEEGIEPDYYESMDEYQTRIGRDRIIETAIEYLNERFAELRQTKKWRK